MSDTPKTDAAYKACRSAGALGIIDPLTQCSALLERQLEEANERNGNMAVELAAMTQERDALRKKLALVTKERRASEAECYELRRYLARAEDERTMANRDRDALRGKCYRQERKLELLGMMQSKMRDPERTIVCDILANGQLLPDADGSRYGQAAKAGKEGAE